LQQEVKLLIKLQAVDLEVKHIQDKKEEGPKGLRHIEKKAKEQEEDLKAVLGTQEELKQKKKGKETELEDEIAHLKKCQGKLMAIKTNREYQALLKEIEEIKKANRKREDEIVAVMEDIERLEKEIKEKQEELSKIREEITIEKGKLDSLFHKYDKELAKFEGNRKTMVKDIPEELLKRYDFLRSKRNGLAVVGVLNAVCLGCHMNIPPQLYNELLKEKKMIYCPSCQRIIYYQDVPKAANEKG